MRVQLSSLRTLAGAASIVVTFAIGVHLVAEGLALGASALDMRFWLRHVYLTVPLALAVWSFAHTVGLGRRRSEMIRRCALVRADMRRAGGGSTIAAFTAANVAFFGFTQLLEGVPIASGASALGLAAAAVGSVLAALIIFFWARPLVAIALAAVAARTRNARAFVRPCRVIVPVSRTAASAFTLFVPNRPPPTPSFA
jgi:hypothetical protein